MSRELRFGLLCALLIAGCNKSSPLRQFETLTDKMCQCSTQVCVDAVAAEFNQLAEQHPDFEPSAAEREQAMTVMSRYAECATRVAGSSTPKKPATPMCGEAPCLAVPSGIKGLLFGMSMDEAAAALSLPVSALSETTPREVLPSIERNWAKDGPVYDPTSHPLELTGTSVTVPTTVGLRAAACTLDFDETSKLAGIFCEIEGTDTKADMPFLIGLREKLTGKHGAPTIVTGKLVWRSSTAVLELSQAPPAAHLNNYSAAHEKLIDKTIKRADEAMRRAIKAHEEALASAEEARKKELEKQLRALDRDTSPAAERPHR